MTKVKVFHPPATSRIRHVATDDYRFPRPAQKKKDKYTQCTIAAYGNRCHFKTQMKLNLLFSAPFQSAQHTHTNILLYKSSMPAKQTHTSSHTNGRHAKRLKKHFVYCGLLGHSFGFGLVLVSGHSSLLLSRLFVIEWVCSTFWFIISCQPRYKFRSTAISRDLTVNIEIDGKFRCTLRGEAKKINQTFQSISIIASG